MIDTESLLSILGLTASDEVLIKCLSENGIEIENELFLSDGEYRAYIERPKYGLSLMFTDEAYFLGKSSQEIGVGFLYLSGLFFYSEGKDGYSQYQGKLPFGLSFDSARTDVVNVLGEQSWQRLSANGERVISERWDDLDGKRYRLHITYDKFRSTISIISVYIPDLS